MNQSSRVIFFATVIILVLLLCYLLAPILPPFLIGMALAYLGDPIADRLERWRLNRTAAVCVVFAVMTLASILILLILFPMVEQQVRSAIAAIPSLAEKINQLVIPRINELAGTQLPTANMASISEAVRSHWQQFGGLLGIIGRWLGDSTGVFIALAATATITPVVTFYLLRDWDLMTARLHDLLPRRIEPKVMQLAREMDLVLAEFVRGQLLLMAAQAAYFSIALGLIGLDLALLVGLIAGGLSFVPYLGLIIGLGSALIAAALQFQEWLPLLLILGVFGIGQVLEGALLQPLLVGDRIGMHPVAVIFAVMAGGQLFGFVGVLLALPAAAVITVLLRHIHDFYKGSELYQRGTPVKPAGETPPVEGSD
ncbi:AI-2E family transporter [Pseudomaricurvus alcaniphilus]|uniref:AI-2E family transporter n=1 Tax=Pseudomaricurvus alcaniphilus TaxID=1166482 RepID=UPI001407FABD|nr:AI-2E family transporter [Pseudomaricurvus alcaniphilus]